jgi:hypothetical protein
MRVNSTINNYNGSGNINGNGNSNINSNINSNVNTNNPNTTITNNPTKPPSTTTIMKDITNHPHPQSHILKKDKE